LAWKPFNAPRSRHFPLSQSLPFMCYSYVQQFGDSENFASESFLFSMRKLVSELPRAYKIPATGSARTLSHPQSLISRLTNGFGYGNPLTPLLLITYM
jgi:hypothetical protein